MIKSELTAVDLFCGLGGWAEGFLAEGYRVIGFDIEQHDYGTGGYPGQLVIQDVLTLHGSQFKDATAIVASPPCQEFSYMAMPWTRGKQIAAAIRGKGEFPAGYAGSRTVNQLRALFDACFRLQREASEAAGRHIPLVIENVRGAQPWVGYARANFGSYYLWGDVPALLPLTSKRVIKQSGSMTPGVQRWCREGVAGQQATGFKTEGMNWSDQTKRGQDFTRIAGRRAMESVKCRDADGYERDHPNAFGWKVPRTSSKSHTRKAASAAIAKIPFPLAQWIARVSIPTTDSQLTKRNL